MMARPQEKKMSNREVVIVSYARTAFTRAHKGEFKDTRPDTLAAEAIKAALARAPGLDPADVEDVILGCAMPEGEQGMNVARIAAMLAGLPETVPALTVNRFCSSGLQTISQAAERIMVGATTGAAAGASGGSGSPHVGELTVALQIGLFAEYNTRNAPYGMGASARLVGTELRLVHTDEFAAAALDSHQEHARRLQAHRRRFDATLIR